MRCLLCGQVLMNEESIKRGVGPGCWEKLKTSKTLSKFVGENKVSVNIKKEKKCFNCVYFKQIWNNKVKELVYKKHGKNSLPGFCILHNPGKTTNTIEEKDMFDAMSHYCKDFKNKHEFEKLDSKEESNYLTKDNDTKHISDKVENVDKAKKKSKKVPKTKISTNEKVRVVNKKKNSKPKIIDPEPIDDLDFDLDELFSEGD